MSVRPDRSKADAASLLDVPTLIAAFIQDRVRSDRPILIGVCGPQGAGKSTACSNARHLLESSGLTTLILSLDDFYLPRLKRHEHAAAIHPLFRTRGVPGTHDIALAIRTINSLMEGQPTLIPSFDKSLDDVLPSDKWVQSPSHPDVVILEGWCVGARPQSVSALSEAVNGLEAKDDPHGVWRAAVNDALASDYQKVFSQLDALCFFSPPDFNIVTQWRQEQENALRREMTQRGESGRHVMSDTEVTRFVQHYERLTRHIIDEMPERADLVIHLDTMRRVTSIVREEEHPAGAPHPLC
ncbi:Zeta-toxin domain-containing protein [Acetobacteraceae bacterium EV16G]|uniref:Zeta-toxin domain-containing protein n=1 Tax=Sorlinia euscelidii TaxID=3081148 RepID=A0ABU7U4C1_9PROT